jgi:hypothetical protein
VSDGCFHIHESTDCTECYEFFENLKDCELLKKESSGRVIYLERIKLI